MASLESLLDALDPDEYRRGRQFERIVAWFLTHAPEYEDQLRRVWLWDDWPDRPSRDLGIDLVAEARSGVLWAIQAKAYAPNYSVTKRDLDSFLAASASRRFSYRLLVATTDRIAANARKTIEHQAIPVGMLLRSDLAESGLRWPASPSRLVAPKMPKKRLRPDQRKAVRDVLGGFQTSERGQMIRACGTGKTLAALGVHEQLNARRTLVLVSSLSLLSQTLREWTANAKEAFEYLAVCSDETVADPDAPVASTHDLGVPVTTNANEIAEFLHQRGPRVIFSAYQSSPQIAEVYGKRRKPPALDLAICDEAHRCAGPVSGDFATILDAKQIRARRRLFMTATPRYFTGRVIREAKVADFEIASMDDEAVFGRVFHRLTFAQAIEQDLLSDYQVVIVGVDDATYKAWAEHGRYVTRDGIRVTDARTLAGQIGLAKAMRKFDLRRVITFHSRVATARQFSNEMPDVIAWMPSSQRPTGRIHADYVSGKMPTGERRRRLSRLANPPPRERSLLSNARCLAEGVDVPTLDGIAFVDPRRSEVDIVQAIGRAIRLAPDKELGTIVVPVFIDYKGDADEVLDQSVFKPVWEVLKALRSHDDKLGEQLDALRTERGRNGTSKRLPKKIVIDLPAVVGVEFAGRLKARIVDATTSSWEYAFGVLEGFVAREGHALVPTEYRANGESGFRLGGWVAEQRTTYRRRQLSTDRITRLQSVPGWSWHKVDDQWEDGFRHLGTFVRQEGTAHPLATYIDDDGFRLGHWVTRQREFYGSHRLSADRAARLEGLPGWTWDQIDHKWESGYRHLAAFVDEAGHARVSKRYVANDGYRLGQWVEVQRRRHNVGSLLAERIVRLEAQPGWDWDRPDDSWERGFGHLTAFVSEAGHARVPKDQIHGGFGLGIWVSRQRTSGRDLLDLDQAARLEALPGWTWDINASRWDEGYVHLMAFVEREGHARVPQSHEEGDFRLGQWVSIQEARGRSGDLDPNPFHRLDALPGWTWTGRHTARWEDGLIHLKAFVAREGHARVPQSHVEGDFQLGRWVNKQRNAWGRGELDSDRVRRLEAVSGWIWTAR